MVYKRQSVPRALSEFRVCLYTVCIVALPVCFYTLRHWVCFKGTVCTMVLVLPSKNEALILLVRICIKAPVFSLVWHFVWLLASMMLFSSKNRKNGTVWRKRHVSFWQSRDGGGAFILPRICGAAIATDALDFWKISNLRQGFLMDVNTKKTFYESVSTSILYLLIFIILAVVRSVLLGRVNCSSWVNSSYER